MGMFVKLVLVIGCVTGNSFNSNIMKKNEVLYYFLSQDKKIAFFPKVSRACSACIFKYCKKLWRMQNQFTEYSDSKSVLKLKIKWFKIHY